MVEASLAARCKLLVVQCLVKLMHLVYLVHLYLCYVSYFGSSKLQLVCSMDDSAIKLHKTTETHLRQPLNKSPRVT